MFRRISVIRLTEIRLFLQDFKITLAKSGNII